MQKHELSITSMCQLVLKISHPKVKNLSKLDIAILFVLSLSFNKCYITDAIWEDIKKNESAVSQESFVQFV